MFSQDLAVARQLNLLPMHANNCYLMQLTVLAIMLNWKLAYSQLFGALLSIILYQRKSPCHRLALAPSSVQH